MTKQSRKTVGQELKLLRKEKLLTPEQMSEKLNLSRNAYCNIEYGETDLTFNRLDKIAETLKVPATESFNNINGNTYNTVRLDIEKESTRKENNAANTKSDGDLHELLKTNSQSVDFLSRQVEILEAKLREYGEEKK